MDSRAIFQFDKVVNHGRVHQWGGEEGVSQMAKQDQRNVLLHVIVGSPALMMPANVPVTGTIG